MDKSINKPLVDLQDDIDKLMQGYTPSPPPQSTPSRVFDAIMACTPGPIVPPPGFNPQQSLSQGQLGASNSDVLDSRVNDALNAWESKHADRTDRLEAQMKDVLSLGNSLKQVRSDMGDSLDQVRSDMGNFQNVQERSFNRMESRVEAREARMEARDARNQAQMLELRDKFDQLMKMVQTLSGRLLSPDNKGMDPVGTGTSGSGSNGQGGQPSDPGSVPPNASGGQGVPGAIAHGQGNQLMSM